MKKFTALYILFLSSFIAYESGAQATGANGNTIDGSYEFYTTNSPGNTSGNRTVWTKLHTSQYFEIRQDSFRLTKLGGSGTKFLTVNNQGTVKVATMPNFSTFLTTANLVPTGNVMTLAAANDAIGEIEDDIAGKLNITDTTGHWKPLTWFPTYAQVTGKPTLFSGAYADLTGKPTLFDGTWVSLTGKPSTFQPSAHTHAPSDIISAPWLTSYTETDPAYTSGITNYYNKTQSDARYLQTYTESDPAWVAASGNYYTKTQGDARYLQSFSEADPNVPAYSKTLTAFSVIKSSTDPLYRPIGYVPSWTEVTSKPTFATVATSGSYNDLSNKPTIPTVSGASGSFGFVVTSNGLVTSGKRLELYSGTTDASGNYTVTFGSAYSVAPNIQASITNQSNTNQQIRVVSVSTTGFTINVYQRNAVTLLTIEVLLAAVVNVNGATVDILVTEK